ncbi:MAG: hypothetical protein IJ730_03985 [Alphaproteobacteria bacterium]|nr:hypothetical protein [Alphaproteobacteria bacterium]
MLKKLFISTIALANNLVATDFNFSINSEISNNHTQEIITPAENFDLYEQVEKEFVTFCKFNGKIIRKNNIGILTKDHYGKNYENYRNELISAAYINRNKKLHVTIKNKTIFFENPPNLLDIESSYSCNISYNFQDSYLNSGLFYDIFCVMLKANYLALQTKEVIELSEKDITENEIYVVQKQTIKDILEEEDFNAKCISYIHAFYQKQPNQNQFIDKYETISNLLPKLSYFTDDSNGLDGWINYLPSCYFSLFLYV